MIDKSIIDGLVANPSETLNVELKRWIDPTQTLGIEKIVKGVLALRNRNGGFFVVGFDDNTLIPDAANEPQNATQLFHVDIIQGLISRYASDPFEIEISWGERDGRQYPIIVVPSGVKVPIAAKHNLMDGTRTAIRLGAVYFRSLASNGTPSTTEARPSDWADIVEICFDNREADVGRFIRRHLAGLDIASLMRLLGQPQAPTPTLCDRALKLIDRGEARFQEAIKARRLSDDEKQMLQLGFWSIGVIIDPARTDAVPNQEFLARIASSNPKYTGWPMWLDARYMSIEESRPKVIKDAFEYLIVSLSPDFSNHIDFARLDPKGEFFLHRLLQDDGVPNRVRPGQVLDPMLMILRVAEAMAVGVAFARALGWPPDQATLGFAFRWHKLKGRRLTAWANPYSTINEGGIAHDDTIEGCVQFSLDTPLSALAQFVDEATKRLFTAFEGATIPRQAIEELVRRLFERRLGF
jgi:hypothetical protein